MVMVMVMFRWLSTLGRAATRGAGAAGAGLGGGAGFCNKSISTKVRNQKFVFLDQLSDYL